MPLPKTEYPLFEITMPSTGEKVNFRRFLAKEEKILLIAKQSDDRLDKLLAIRQVINNCAADQLDVDKMTTFDFDYTFLKLRAQSVDNFVEMAYKDDEDDQEYIVRINLDSIEISLTNDVQSTISVDDTHRIKMRYLTIGDVIAITQDIMADGKKAADNPDHVQLDLGDLLLERVIDSIYDEETKYDDYTREELFEWLDQLPGSVVDQMKSFLEAIPDVEYKTSYTTKAGTVREIALRGIDDFFTL